MIGFIHERQVSVRSAIHSSRRAELPRGSDLQPKRAEPGASAPLGFACPIAPITVPDRHAVPTWATRCRRDVRMTEPRGGACSGAVRGWRGSQESTHCRSVLLGCMTNVPLGFELQRGQTLCSCFRLFPSVEILLRRGRALLTSLNEFVRLAPNLHAPAVFGCFTLCVSAAVIP